MTTQSASDDTRSKILDLAELLWLGRGFNGFSYQHISKELGVKNAAIHYHFPHKEDLGVALIKRYRRRLARYIEAQATQDALVKLDRFFSLIDTYFLNDRQICPTGTLSVEFNTLPDSMREEASVFMQDMLDWAADIVKEGKSTGVMRFAGREQDMAALLCAGLQGALQLARMAPDLLEHTKAALRVQLGLPQPDVAK